jgi:hypothetical protein
MRKLIYLVFHDSVRASFTRDESFDVNWWASRHNTMLWEIGVKGVEFEEVDDDFRLSWETA